jgi:hypothetical protein
MTRSSGAGHGGAAIAGISNFTHPGLDREHATRKLLITIQRASP